MSVRLLTSLNWLVGTFAIGLAVVVPPALDRFKVEPARGAAAATVTAIVEAEKKYFQSKERYLPFGGTATEISGAGSQLGISIPVSEFLFDAYSDDRHSLVVRAFTSPAALAAGSLPPMLYRYRIPYDGQPAAEWEKLSGRSPGLTGLPGSLAALF